MQNESTETVRGTDLRLDLLSCDQVYRAERAFRNLMMHEQTEICLVVSGVGVCCVLNQEFPCKAGDIFIIPANTPHRFFLAEKDGTLAVRRLRFRIGDWFEGEIARPESPRYCYGVFNDNAIFACAPLNVRMREKAGALFDDIETERTEKREEWTETVRCDLAQLLINVGRYLNCSIKNGPSVSPAESQIVLAALRAVKERYGDADLTLASLAELFSVSASHISKLFKSVTGRFFSDYLRSVRLDEACRLLKDSTLTVEEIVPLCGLRDVPSFYKNFNRYLNTTPAEYRQTLRRSATEAEHAKKQTEEKRMSILNEISENLQKGKAKLVKELVQQAIDEGLNPSEILDQGLLAGMNVIGEKFKNNEVFVPEVLVAARAMNMGAQILKPLLAEAGAQASGKVCIGTVQGDLHDIGKNLVKMMMEGKGLEVVDLGTDVSPEAFVQTAIEQDCRIICCSALLTTTMGVMAKVVEEAEKAGIRDKVKIMIGGAPVTEDFCREIGADAYTPDAASAAEKALAFCKEA